LPDDDGKTQVILPGSWAVNILLRGHTKASVSLSFPEPRRSLLR